MFRASCGHVVCLSCCGLEICGECRAPIDRFVTPFALKGLIAKLVHLHENYRRTLTTQPDQTLASLDEMMEIDRIRD
jgi:hypothetical protein